MVQNIIKNIRRRYRFVKRLKKRYVVLCDKLNYLYYSAEFDEAHGTNGDIKLSEFRAFCKKEHIIIDNLNQTEYTLEDCDTIKYILFGL